MTTQDDLQKRIQERIKSKVERDISICLNTQRYANIKDDNKVTCIYFYRNKCPHAEEQEGSDYPKTYTCTYWEKKVKW